MKAKTNKKPQKNWKIYKTKERKRQDNTETYYKHILSSPFVNGIHGDERAEEINRSDHYVCVCVCVCMCGLIWKFTESNQIIRN